MEQGSGYGASIGGGGGIGVDASQKLEAVSGLARQQSASVPASPLIHASSPFSSNGFNSTNSSNGSGGTGHIVYPTLTAQIAAQQSSRKLALERNRSVSSAASAAGAVGVAPPTPIAGSSSRQRSTTGGAVSHLPTPGAIGIGVGVMPPDQSLDGLSDDDDYDDDDGFSTDNGGASIPGSRRPSVDRNRSATATPVPGQNAANLNMQPPVPLGFKAAILDMLPTDVVADTAENMRTGFGYLHKREKRKKQRRAALHDWATQQWDHIGGPNGEAAAPPAAGSAAGLGVPSSAALHPDGGGGNAAATPAGAASGLDKHSTGGFVAPSIAAPSTPSLSALHQHSNAHHLHPQHGLLGGGSEASAAAGASVAGSGSGTAHGGLSTPSAATRSSSGVHTSGRDAAAGGGSHPLQMSARTTKRSQRVLTMSSSAASMSVAAANAGGIASTPIRGAAGAASHPVPAVPPTALSFASPPPLPARR